MRVLRGPETHRITTATYRKKTEFFGKDMVDCSEESIVPVDDTLEGLSIVAEARARVQPGIWTVREVVKSDDSEVGSQQFEAGVTGHDRFIVTS